MDSTQRKPVPNRIPTLKPAKVKLSFKKNEIRQCRLCLRVLPKAETMPTRTGAQPDLRRKILDAVGVRITSMCKIQCVCVNCLLIVDIIYQFRAACRQADTLHGTHLLMMHPGKWLGEENKRILDDCRKLVQRNRAEMQGLFKCSGLAGGDVHLLTEGNEVLIEEAKPESPTTNGNEVLLEAKKEEEHREESQQMEHDISDSDPEQTERCAQMLDAPVIFPRTKQPRRGIKDHMCELCGKTMQKSFAETHHNKIHMRSNPYKCPEADCKKRFPSRIYLNSHLKKAHSNQAQEVESFECPTCSKWIRHRKQFRYHLLTHAADVHPQKKACEVCGKYVYKRYLKDHMFVHTGELPYSCEFCDRKYAARTNLIIHRKKKHADQLQVLEEDSQ